MGVVADMISVAVAYRDELIVASLLIVGLIYLYLSRNLSKLSQRLGLPRDVENAVRLIIRVVIMAIYVALFASLFNVPLSVLVGSSALAGAVIGFGASQTINNIIAGLYVIIARPFLLRDFVRIGDVEGQVEEISINYTKLYTSSFNILNIPNVQVINSKVLNITHEDLIKYTFSIGFSHNLDTQQLIDRCLRPGVEEFVAKNKAILPRDPEYYLEKVDMDRLTFKVRMFVPKGEAKLLYRLQPDLLNMIMNRKSSLTNPNK